MERKYIFFDIDGTLTDANPGGKILESTYRTLDQLKANGHFVAIATGRAQYMAMSLPAWNFGGNPGGIFV